MSNTATNKLLGIDPQTNGGIKKTHAMEHFMRHTRSLVEHIQQRKHPPIKASFSDDCSANITAMEVFFRNLRQRGSLDELRLYDTSKYHPSSHPNSGTKIIL